MLALFWDCKGATLEHYMARGVTVNSESYCGLLENHFTPSVGPERCSLLSASFLLQPDNARHHTARATIQRITNLHSECLTHAAYSLGLAQLIITCLDPSQRGFRLAEIQYRPRY